MRKSRILLLIALIGLLGISLPEAAFAADVTVSAEVTNNSPEITLVVKELTTPGQDPWSGATVGDMNFGQLTHTLTGGAEAGVWYSQKYYAVMIFTNSFGHRYEIRSTCAGLTSGANSLPSGSFGLTPGYASQDEWSPGNAQGAQPTGSTLGSAGPAITTNKVIYQSETAASNRILRAFYSLPAYLTDGASPFTGYTPIPLTQPAGTYTGTVTITIAAI